ncbi:MAG: hypothetical protein ACM3IK_16195 [Sphingomonadaceae bacterium]
MPNRARRWHLLFGGRDRPMLIPAGAYAMQRACLRHFLGDRRAAWVGSALLKANALWPGAGLLPEVRLHKGRPGIDGALAAREPAYVAFQVGTPGPHQKASALYLTESGEGIALAKTAMASSADATVRREAGWLEMLPSIEPLAGQVPRLLDEGVTPEGRRYLVVSAAPSTGTSFTFTPAHARFLGALGRARLEIGHFRESLVARTLRARLQDLRGILPESRVAAFQAAVADCHAWLSDYGGPLVISQGDFAPWNIRVLSREVFVFDWEYACTAANPLADALHYLLMPRAVRGRRVGGNALATALGRTHEFARQTYPEWRWHERTVSALALAYLLEVLMRFTLASGRFEPRHPVMAAYWQLIERRSSWMAQ